MKKTQLEQVILKEFGNMHHNASLARYYPNFQNDYESDLFWNCLDDELSFLIEDLHEAVKEKFDYDWKFYQYGRSGATIAPNELVGPAPCNNFGGFNWDAMPEDYHEMQKLLKAMQFVNEYWKESVKNVNEWWKDIKEANDYQKDIDAHDGMVQKQVYVWVKA